MIIGDVCTRLYFTSIYINPQVNSIIIGLGFIDKKSFYL